MASRVKGKPASPPRRYDASWRRAQARETQRHIAETARALFLDRGYGATSIRQIADAAGVAVQTIYNAFEGKPAIVARIADMAIVGDDEPVALIDRPHVQAIGQGTDAGVMVRQWASLCRGIFTRFLPLLPILGEAAAADPAVRALWRNNAVINRYEETKSFVTHLAALVNCPKGSTSTGRPTCYGPTPASRPPKPSSSNGDGHRMTTRRGPPRRSVESLASTEAIAPDRSIPSRAKHARSKD